MPHRDMTALGAAQTRALFEHRRLVNLDFESRFDRSKGYHEFVRDTLKVSGGSYLFPFPGLDESRRSI